MHEAPVVIALDVTDLDRSCAFYERTLGLSVRAVERPGLILESRLLAGPRYPGVALHLRKQFGIRVSGSHPGTLMRISLHTPDLPRLLPALRDGPACWVGPPPPDTAPHVFMVDPDGYEIELFVQRSPLVNPPQPVG